MFIELEYCLSNSDKDIAANLVNKEVSFTFYSLVCFTEDFRNEINMCVWIDKEIQKVTKTLEVSSETFLNLQMFAD